MLTMLIDCVQWDANTDEIKAGIDTQLGVATPSEISDIIVFLAGDKARWCQGQPHCLYTDVLFANVTDLLWLHRLRHQRQRRPGCQLRQSVLPSSYPLPTHDPCSFRNMTVRIESMTESMVQAPLNNVDFKLVRTKFCPCKNNAKHRHWFCVPCWQLFSLLLNKVLSGALNHTIQAGQT